VKEDAELKPFVQLIEALAPWLEQVVLIGGWAHRLYRLDPRAQTLRYAPLTTVDSAFAVPLKIEAKETSIRDRLLAAGFRGIAGNPLIDGQISTVFLPLVSTNLRVLGVIWKPHRMRRLAQIKTGAEKKRHTNPHRPLTTGGFNPPSPPFFAIPFYFPSDGSFGKTRARYVTCRSGQINTLNSREKLRTGLALGKRIPAASAIVFTSISASACCNGQGRW